MDSVCTTLYFEKVWDIYRFDPEQQIFLIFREKYSIGDWYRIINRAMRDSGILPTAGSFSYIIYCLIILNAGSINNLQANAVCFF